MINFSTLKGLTIPVLPKGYTKIEYIQSTGTQYIDTGYSAPDGFIADIVFEYTGSTDGCILGAHDLASPWNRNYIKGAKLSKNWVVGTGNTDLMPETTVTSNKKYTLHVSTVKGNSYLDVDGTRVGISNNKSARSALNLWLFYHHYNEYNELDTTPGKLYSAKIYSPDGTLVRDFMPCKNASGVAGLYDLVNDEFYGNAGSGEFVAGAEIGTSDGLCAVTQIADASGRVLWSAVKPATITITGTGDATYSYVTIDGVKYTSPATLEVPVGTVITCFVGDKDKENGAFVTVNGNFVLKATSGGSYDYTVVGNIIIQLNYSGGVGSITITQIRNDPATITTKSAGYSSNYVDYAYIDFTDATGTAYRIDSQGGTYDTEASAAAGAPVWVNTFTIPAGTTITCYVKTGSSYMPAYVKINGTEVLRKTSGDATYTYLVTGNAIIKLYTTGSGTSNAYGYIEITEIPEIPEGHVLVQTELSASSKTNNYAYVTVDGVDYYTAKGLAVKQGSTIRLCIGREDEDYGQGGIMIVDTVGGSGLIQKNYADMTSMENGNFRYYDYTVDKNMRIVLTTSEYKTETSGGNKIESMYGSIVVYLE